MGNWHCTDGIGSHSDAMGPNEGVYAIYVIIKGNIQKLVYIGRSFNLQKRWKNHSVYRLLVDKGDIVFVKWKYCSNSVKFERNLIKRLQPSYNQVLYGEK